MSELSRTLALIFCLVSLAACTKPQSPEEYVAELEEALSSNDYESFSSLVDVDAILASGLDVYLSSAEGEVTEQSSSAMTEHKKIVQSVVDRREDILRFLKRDIQSKIAGSKKHVDRLFPEDARNIYSQAKSDFSITSVQESNDKAYVGLKFEHPSIDQISVADLTLLATDNHQWRLTEIRNLSKIIESFNTKIEQLESSRLKEISTANEKDRLLLASALSINTSRAVASLRENGSSARLRIIAVNNDGNAIENAELECRLKLADQELFLGNIFIGKLAPGETLQDDFEILIDFPEDLKLKKMQQLNVDCSASNISFKDGNGMGGNATG